VIAWILIGFEAVPLTGLIMKTVTLWTIDGQSPDPTNALAVRARVAVLIPTYNEPVEVIAPTIAAACALEPVHETWVLDDGDRPWVAEMAEAFGARYVSRTVRDHAKAGNINNALAIMAAEEATGGVDIIAVLDCDHVPLPTFLTATLGWFADPQIALVQGPQAFYNAGAFDDDGFTGEQGLFFNVLLPARHHAGAGPFWCGSTALVRVKALQEVGGVATETITEDLHTTLKLIRAGWKTAYHHQTLAVGLAPATPDQYLLQRRRWGMGAMQILVHERLWAPKRWMSWRNFHDYLNGTLWWLEGIGTLISFAVPAAILFSGARTSTASPLAFTIAFVAMFSSRLWGSKRLLRGQIHWPTAFALRILRIPVGLACMWWLVSRKTLDFVVTPKAGVEDRRRGRPPRILWVLAAAVGGICTYAGAGVGGWVPWRTSTPATVASGLWLALAGVVLLLGVRRIRAPRYATSRRNGYRVPFTTPVYLDGSSGRLVDVSVGGAAVRLDPGSVEPGRFVMLDLPSDVSVKTEVVAVRNDSLDRRTISVRVPDGDWEGYGKLALWLFHTPAGQIPELPPGVPIAAATIVA
jgi:cellulose synthase (UDP-forming)